MSGAKKTNIIIDQEERQLVYHSEFINKYPILRELLGNKIKISKNDLINIRNKDNDLYNLIKYNFENIVKESSKEWSAFKYDGEDSKRCSLCNTPNKYIFLIRNRMNNRILNVGSECIKKFPGIVSSIDGVSIEKIKRNRIKEIERMSRISEFNNKYPDIEHKLRVWKEDYDNLPITMPKIIHYEFNRILSGGKEFYNDYINGKIPKKQLDNFNRYICNYDNLISKINKFIESNKNSEFICTKEIRDWLISNNLKGILDLIINEGGYISLKSVSYIYYFPFVQQYKSRFQNIFYNLKFALESFNSDEVVFSHIFIRLYKVYFRISLKEFMNKYGKIIFEEGFGITVSSITENFEIVKSEQNYSNITNIINSEAYKEKYYVKIDLEKNQLEIENKTNGRYCYLKADLFVRSSISCLLEDENQGSIMQLINKIENWRNISDKKKFNEDGIEKMMKTR